MATPRVMRMGDSHTVALALYGGMADALGSQVQWVGSVQSGDGPHEGHGGWALNAILGHLDGWMRDSRPDIVTLEIGTNDAAGNRDPGAMLKDLGVAARKIGKSAKLILVTIPPYPAKSDIQAAYNEGIRALVNQMKSEGYVVRLADVDKSVTTSDLGGDKIHMNAAGVKKAASVIDAQIQGFTGPSWKKIAAVGAFAITGILLLTWKRWWT